MHPPWFEESITNRAKTCDRCQLHKPPIPNMAREITRVRPFIEENTKTVSLTFMERPSPTGLDGSFVFEPLSSASKESRLQPNTRPIKCSLSPQDDDHQGYRMSVIHAGERSCFCCIKHFVIVLHG